LPSSSIRSRRVLAGDRQCHSNTSGLLLDDRGHRVKGHARRVRIILSDPDDLRARPRCPGLELSAAALPRERVGRAEQPGMPVTHERHGELARLVVFPSAVTPDHEG